MEVARRKKKKVLKTSAIKVLTKKKCIRKGSLDLLVATFM
jgi:hypothetical protein